MRLFVDGVRVIDQWIDQGADDLPRHAAAGRRSAHVVMEYYENGGGAVGPPELHAGRRPAAGHPVSRASTGTRRTATGPPSIPTRPADLERDDETLDFDWGDGSPGAGIAADRFVARWTKTVALSAGVYRFTGVHDDGIRAYIDDVPVVDHWSFGNTDYSVDKVVAGGTHELRVEYFEARRRRAGGVHLRADRRRRAPPTVATTPSTSTTATSPARRC